MPGSGPRRPPITRTVIDAFQQSDRRKLLDQAKAELQAERAKPKRKRSKRSR